MKNAKNVRVVHVDMYTKSCLTIIAVLLFVMIVGLWAESPDFSDSAKAQKYADPQASDAISQGRWGTSSAPQQAMVKAQADTNAKLDQLMDLLRSGQVKIQLVGDLKPTSGDANAKNGQK